MRRVAFAAVLLGVTAAAGTVWIFASAGESPIAAVTRELGGTAPEGAEAGGPHMNRLAAEASPYLQLHVQNPVNWYPWGEEAFARARAESKPIFLSVGYSTCYWCHVMERKVFSDPEIAALMNETVVSIKVDREERPDVDAIYMQATSLLTRGGGGWPNSVFLTPEGEPFFAGTYFPPEDRPRRPGFPRVLRRVANMWKNEREHVLDTARRVARTIAAGDLGTAPGEVPPVPVLLERASEQLARAYDPEHGGFSRGRKFPMPSRLELLLASHGRNPEAKALEMVTHTLDKMALGGIYDHLAGGFHRYTVERSWSIPHFEKMLYDNAQLVAVYSHAYAATQRPLYRRVVREVVAYLEREMTHPEGGFFAAQDAEVAGAEGASYVWSRDEIEAVLGDEAARRFLSAYQLVGLHEHPGLGVLRVRLPIKPALRRTGAKDAAELLARFDEERAKLLASRRLRPQPLRDEKVIAAWNGLAIRGLVEAAEALREPAYLRLAERAARFVLDRLMKADGRLHRAYIAGRVREDAVLDDYAFLADGLLGLYRATGEAAWLARARSLADQMLARFEDPAGGFYLTGEGSALFARLKRIHDGAMPSGNALAFRVLRELAAEGGGERYGKAAERTAAAVASVLGRAPSSLGATVIALNQTPGPDGRALAAAKPSGSPAPAASRLPRSEDHVRVTLRPDAKPAARFVVGIDIDPGWHVNANPASLPFLIPTSVELSDGARAGRIDYPPGEAFRPEFGDGELAVYHGHVEIPVTLSDAAEQEVGVAVRYQACDVKRCLPPGVTRATLRPTPR